MRREPKKRWKVYLVPAAIILVVLAGVGFMFYNAYVAPFQRVIITVDDTQIRADQFLERARLSGSDPMGMTLGLTNEILIRKGAAQLGISVTQQDIDDELRRAAKGEDETISDAAFKEWYRQQIAQARVSEATFREVVQNNLLAMRMQQHLGEQASLVVPQVHVSGIFVSTEADAKQVVDRLKAGENFGTLAREVSTDEKTRQDGGDLGWMPRGVAIFDATAFSLEVGKFSDPIPYVTDQESPPAFYYVLLVTEKSDARQVDEQFVESVKGRALNDWLTSEIGRHKVAWDFNSEIYAWMKVQLAKSQSSAQSSASQKPSGGQQ
jgi:parvulin-like peptidyl-prolyl isomerase